MTTPTPDAPAQPQPQVPDDGILRIGDNAETPRYEVMFRIGGTPYEGIANPNGGILAKYLDTLRKRGGNVAVSWLLERMLEPDAYAALLDNPKVSDTDIRTVTDLVTGLVLGTRTTAPKATQ